MTSGRDGDGTGDGESPRYRRIADDLRDRITGGHLTVGDLLPKQHQLQRRYGVGRGTVQSALRLLRDEGLIEEGVPGRGARVADRLTLLQPLSHHIARAFAAREVSLDVWSLTTENLSKAVQNQADRIRQGQHRPDSIAVRVLLPDLVTEHPYPRHVDDPSDPRPLQRLRHEIRTYASALEHSLTALAEERLVRSVRVEIRGMPTIPGEKRYIINDSEVLTGFYSIRRHHMRNNPDGTSLDILQLHSDGSLFPFSRDTGAGAGSLDEERFTQIRLWFESRWTQVARPLPLAH